MPAGVVYVGRIGTRGGGIGSPYANPFMVGGWFMMGDPDPRAKIRMSWCETYRPGGTGFTLIKDRQMAVDWFREYRRRYPLSEKHLARLRGKDLACWCRLDQPCHADVLLEVANR